MFSPMTWHNISYPRDQVMMFYTPLFVASKAMRAGVAGDADVKICSNLHRHAEQETFSVVYILPCAEIKR